MSEYEKYRQVCREAVWTGVTLLVLIAAWLVLGFGLAPLGGTVFGLSVWTLASTVGFWLFAVALVALLVHVVFRDMDLGADDGEARK